MELIVADDIDAELPMGTEEHVRQELEPFFKRHPSSSLGRVHKGDETLLAISSPWGDPTLVTLVGDKPDELARVLNEVHLPERLSAVWHLDSKDLEVIWTAYKLSDSQRELIDRSFTFQFRKRSFECEFGSSSDRLLAIAAATVPGTNPSGTFFRNLTSFRAWAESDQEERRLGFLDKPRSFWIKGADLTETQLLELIEHINFYMTYFDSNSPSVLVHHLDEGGAKPKKRYVRGKFPKRISARVLDENLLSFWAAADRENEMLRFI